MLTWPAECSPASKHRQGPHGFLLHTNEPQQNLSRVQVACFTLKFIAQPFYLSEHNWWSQDVKLAELPLPAVHSFSRLVYEEDLILVFQSPVFFHCCCCCSDSHALKCTLASSADQQLHAAYKHRV